MCVYLVRTWVSGMIVRLVCADLLREGLVGRTTTSPSVVCASSREYGANILRDWWWCMGVVRKGGLSWVELGWVGLGWAERRDIDEHALMANII